MMGPNVPFDRRITAVLGLNPLLCFCRFRVAAIDAALTER